MYKRIGSVTEDATHNSADNYNITICLRENITRTEVIRHPPHFPDIKPDTLRIRQQIFGNLRGHIEKGVPIIGVGVSNVIFSKFEEIGGVDLMVVYNSRRFRRVGLLPFLDANVVVIEMANEVLLVVKKVHVFAGVTGSVQLTSNIANAYNITEVIGLLVSTLLVPLVMLLIWISNIFLVLCFLLIFRSIEVIDWSAGLTTFEEGGWLALVVAFCFICTIYAWNYGSGSGSVLKYQSAIKENISVDFLVHLGSPFGAVRTSGIGLISNELMQVSQEEWFPFRRGYSSTTDMLEKILYCKLMSQALEIMSVTKHLYSNEKMLKALLQFSHFVVKEISSSQTYFFQCQPSFASFLANLDHLEIVEDENCTTSTPIWEWFYLLLRNRHYA